MAGGVDGLHPSLPYLEAVMSLLAIDIETFSDVDLPKCGVYAYHGTCAYCGQPFQSYGNQTRKY